MILKFYKEFHKTKVFGVHCQLFEFVININLNLLLFDLNKNINVINLRDL